MPSQTPQVPTVGDVWELVFRNKLKLFVLPLVVLMLAVGVILFFPRTYRSEAKVFLRVGRESVGIDPSATTGSTISLMQSGRDAEVKSAIDILGSRGVISMVVDELGVDYVLGGGPPSDKPVNPVTESLKNAVGYLVGIVKSVDPISDREEAIIEIEKNLEIDAERDSTVIVLQYDSKSAIGAQGVLQQLVDVYKREHMRIHRNHESSAFFADQRGLLEEQLNEAQQRVLDTKNRMRLGSVGDRRSTLEGQLRAIELSVYEAEQQMETANATMRDLRQQLSVVPAREISSKKSIPNEGADLLRDQLYARELELAGLRSKFNDGHPRVVAVSAQVQEARKVVEAQSSDRQETTDDVNPNFRNLSLDHMRQQSLSAGIKSRIETLAEQRAVILADIEQLNHNEVELDRLERDEQIARAKFFQYANSLEQSRIDKALEDQHVSSISIAQEATRAEKPAKPSKLLVTVGGMFLAIALGLGSTGLSERLNDRVRNESDLETATELPVLASIPDSPIYSRTLNY